MSRYENIFELYIDLKVRGGKFIGIRGWYIILINYWLDNMMFWYRGNV